MLPQIPYHDDDQWRIRSLEREAYACNLFWNTLTQDPASKESVALLTAYNLLDLLKDGKPTPLLHAVVQDHIAFREECKKFYEKAMASLNTDIACMDKEKASNETAAAQAIKAAAQIEND